MRFKTSQFSAASKSVLKPIDANLQADAKGLREAQEQCSRYEWSNYATLTPRLIQFCFNPLKFKAIDAN